VRRLEARGRRLIALCVVLVLAVVVVAVEMSSDRRSQRPVTFGPGEVLFRDDFTRRVALGWGQSSDGKSYTVQPVAGHSVKAGRGRTELTRSGATLTETPNGVVADDVMVSVDVTAPAPTTSGNGVYVSVQTRANGSDYYRSLLRFGPGGRVLISVSRVMGGTEIVTLGPERTVATGVTPGTSLALAVQVTGASPVSLSVGLHRPGEAGGSQLQVSDASASRLVVRGEVGLRSYLGGTTRAPKTVQLDNLVVRRMSALPLTPPGRPTAG